MGYKEVGGPRSYLKFKDCEKGQVLVEGTFVREFEGKYGKQYEYMQDNGEVIVLNGSGQLKYKMDFVKEDSKVKVIYDGEIMLESGVMKGKMAHQFVVMQDSDYEETAENEGVEGDTGLSEFGDL